jgi:DNA-binding protein
MPEIPDIKPEIHLKRDEVINLLLASIALEEIGLSHVINAEGEKLQKAIQVAECFEDLIVANNSVERMLKTIIKKEMLLQFKLEDVLEIPDEHHPHPPHHGEPPKPPNHDHRPPKPHPRGD